jgi:hypothetical protein
VDLARVVVGCDPSEAPLPPQAAITTPAATPHATNAARRRHGGSWRARLRRSICRRAALSGAGFTVLPPFTVWPRWRPGHSPMALRDLLWTNASCSEACRRRASLRRCVAVILDSSRTSRRPASSTPPRETPRSREGRSATRSRPSVKGVSLLLVILMPVAVSISGPAL